MIKATVTVESTSQQNRDISQTVSFILAMADITTYNNELSTQRCKCYLNLKLKNIVMN